MNSDYSGTFDAQLPVQTVLCSFHCKSGTGAERMRSAKSFLWSIAGNFL